MMAVLLCDWQGDNDDDLPTLRPQICLLPPVQLNSSDDDRAACQTCQTALFPPALLSMAPLASSLGPAGGSSRGQRLLLSSYFQNGNSCGGCICNSFK